VIISYPKPSDSIAIAVTAIMDEEEKLANNQKHPFLATSQIFLLAAEQGHWYKEQSFP